MSFISLPEYQASLENFNVTGCAIRDRNFIYLVAREDYTRWPKDKWNSEEQPPPADRDVPQRIVIISRKEEEGRRMGSIRVTGVENLLAGACIKPAAQFVGVSSSGEVYASGGGFRDFEPDILGVSKGGPYRGGVFKLRTIAGWLYFCGGNNSVGKRTGKGEWFSHTSDIPDPKRTDHRHNSFDDIDGFAEDDIYCVGSEGQVYHFDGRRWQRLAFPSNVDLETVCCAGDGQVYVSGRKGMTFRGRGERWELIHPGGDMSLPFRDMVWHEDRVWCTSDYGVWTIHDGKLESADLPDGVKAYAGNLAAADGVLLLAGYGGAAFLEGGRWTKVFSAGEMARAAKARSKP